MSAAAARLLLLSDRGCPFAHRVRALLAHLEVAHDMVESPPAQRPAGLGQWSPSGRVPMLVHGDMSIGESRVMLDYIAEVHSFDHAYPPCVIERTLQREAMAIIDGHIAPALFHDSSLGEPRLAEYLDRLEALSRVTPPIPSVLSFHIAPIWLRLQWWRPDERVTRTIRERSRLVEWLDATTQLSAIVRTAPNRTENTRDFEAVMCALKQAV